MVSLFIVHAVETTACAVQIRLDLEGKGYTFWRQPATLNPQSLLYPRTIERVIVGSAAVIVVWEAHAAQGPEVERQLAFAQQLQKLVLPVMLDTTNFPATLDAISLFTPATTQPPCVDVMTLLTPHLPAPDSTDLLITASEQIAHEYIRVRRQGIDQAAELLKDGIQHKRVLALLEYVARNDLTMTLRQKAQRVLNEDARYLPLSLSRPQDSRYAIGARCRNGHLSWFDKRVACVSYGPVYRGTSSSEAELQLPCQSPGCGLMITISVDCEGYQ